MIKVFISYSHEDETFRIDIEKFLVIMSRQKLINIWSDRKIDFGSDLSQDINKHLLEANIILPLTSQDFLNSNYCYEIEMTLALERHAKNEAIVIPIILRPCDWLHTPLKDLKALPKDGKPITLWDNKDSAYLDMTQGIRSVINKMINKERIMEPLIELGAVKGIPDRENIEGNLYIKGDRTYIPVRYLAHKVGIREENILWDATKSLLILIKNDIVVQTKVGSSILLINGIEVTIDVSTGIIDGVVMVPLIYFAQIFGVNITMDHNKGTLMMEKWI